MRTIDLSTIQIMEKTASTGETSGGTYDDTEIKQSITDLDNTKADKTEIPSITNLITADNIKAGNNVSITKDGNNVTINAAASGGENPSSMFRGIPTALYEYRGQQYVEEEEKSYYIFTISDVDKLVPGDVYNVQVRTGGKFSIIDYFSDYCKFTPQFYFDYKKLGDFSLKASGGVGFVANKLCTYIAEGEMDEPVNPSADNVGFALLF